MVAAEDARPAGGPEFRVLTEATTSPVPALRVVGVRALGRLDRPELGAAITPLLADPDAGVRAEAANALAQSVHRGDGTPALRPLLRRVDAEEDPWVRGVLARSIGRLHLGGGDRASAGRALLALSRDERGTENAPPGQLVGATLGLEAFVRAGRDAEPGPAVTRRLRELARYRPGGRPGDDPDPARIREVALLALGPRRALEADDVADALGDADARVRWAGAAGLARWPVPAPLELVDRTLADSSAQVRLEGVRALAAAPRDSDRCSRLTWAAGGDADTGVRLTALDALGTSCPGVAGAVAVLERVAMALPAGAGGDWHAPAHALVALARIDAPRARALLPRFLAHPDGFVRTYGARAAFVLGDTDALRALATDPDANARAEALTGLSRRVGAAGDATYLAALGDDAPQVVLAAAAALEGATPRGEVRDSALSALQRLGRTGMETLRDARVALVEVVGENGGAADADRLEPFLRDRDAEVAERAARVLERWTGEPYLAAPRSPTRPALPTPAELRAMERGEVVLTMARGGTVRIRLLPFQAPTNAYRFYRMVRTAALNGRTFHRVVPNFVVQGGSPLANEYAGNGAFTRDEVGLTVQWRGTVGVSTRGRDTGDGQIYVNLVDDVRLDHDYTILGVVTSGMDVVDRILEGDVIERAAFEPGTAPSGVPPAS